MSEKVLVVDDERDIANLLEVYSPITQSVTGTVC